MHNESKKITIFALPNVDRSLRERFCLVPKCLRIGFSGVLGDDVNPKWTERLSKIYNRDDKSRYRKRDFAQHRS